MLSPFGSGDAPRSWWTTFPSSRSIPPAGRRSAPGGPDASRDRRASHRGRVAAHASRPSRAGDDDGRLPLFVQGAALYALRASFSRRSFSSDRVAAPRAGQPWLVRLVPHRRRPRARLRLDVRPGDRGSCPRPGARCCGRDRQQAFGRRPLPTRRLLTFALIVSAGLLLMSPGADDIAGEDWAAILAASRPCRSPSRPSQSSWVAARALARTPVRFALGGADVGRHRRLRRVPGSRSATTTLQDDVHHRAAWGDLVGASLRSLARSHTDDESSSAGSSSTTDRALAGPSWASSRPCSSSEDGWSPASRASRATRAPSLTTPGRSRSWRRSAPSALSQPSACSRLRSQEPQRAQGGQRSLAGGHTRVVHDFSAASGQFRRATGDHERATARRRLPGARSRTKVRSSSPSATASPLLRLCAIGGAGATGVVLLSAALSLGRAHWAATLIALPSSLPCSLRRSSRTTGSSSASLVAVAALLAAIASGGLVAVTDSAAWALATTSRSRGRARRSTRHRGAVLPWRARPGGATTRLPDAHEAAGHVAAAAHRRRGNVRRRRRDLRPVGSSRRLMLVGLTLACGGAGALNHVLDADIDRLMGDRTASRPVASGRVAAPDGRSSSAWRSRRCRSPCSPRP